ncbi:MAG: SPOR domain-containing protein [Hydrogenovibrio sp.]
MKQPTRDYRHGHIQKRQPYQRKSQLDAPPAKEMDANVSEPSSRWVWGLALLLSAVLFGGFFVVQHFAQHGVKSVSASDESLDGKTTGSQLSSQAQTDEVDEAGEAQSTSLDTAAENSVEADPASEVGSGASSDDEAATSRRLVVESLTTSFSPMETEPAYTFYEGLAKTEVVVLAEPISVALSVPHYIQAGTFRTRQRAERERARLAAKGQDLTLTALTWKGDKYYRLRVGPFDDRLEMNKKRNELHALGVDTLVVRSPKTAQ